MRILKIAGAIELGALSTNDFVLVFVTYGRRECLSVDVLEPLECIWIDSRRVRVQNGPSAELSVLNRSERFGTTFTDDLGSQNQKKKTLETQRSDMVRTIWDHVYRRFGLAKSENAINTLGSKRPRLSDLISLDAWRSKIMLHLAGNQETPLFKMVHREFHTLRRIY